MKVVLLRVGIDTGTGGMHGPLIDAENHYEYIPIPDDKYEIDERTYGETNGMLRKQPLIEYFPKKTQEDNANKPIHYDPEFETFTYGDPTSLKGRLRELEKGDLLIFYCGLEGFGGHKTETADLYLFAYFEVELAGYAKDLIRELGEKKFKEEFAKNYHVLHDSVFKEQKEELVLVKGNPKRSRILERAIKFSKKGENKAGEPMNVISDEMQKRFGDFKGKIGFPRSSPRWVVDTHIDNATQYVKSLK